jgi:hypothetical protein
MQDKKAWIYGKTSIKARISAPESPLPGTLVNLCITGDKG